MEDIVSDQWLCYILRSKNPLYPNKTYIGSTNSAKRRIRQHNGIIVGGAKATRIMRPNEIICVITGFSDHISTLRCEWLLKHPDGKKRSSKIYSGISGRLRGVQHLFTQSKKWKDRSNGVSLDIWINESYANHFDMDQFCGIDTNIYIC